MRNALRKGESDYYLQHFLSFNSQTKKFHFPQYFHQSQNFPNPFNPGTKIQFALKQEANVKLKVYNILEEEKTKLLNGDMKAGIHEVEFHASELSNHILLKHLQIKIINN